MFPEMDQPSFAELCESIARHGIRQPVYTHKGFIVDGRHRAKAGRLLGVPVPYVEWEGDEAELIEFVADCNLRRRDLTPGQRAAISVEVKDRLNAEYRKRRLGNLRRGNSRVANSCNSGADARKEAAALLGVNHAYVADAEKIRRASVETFDDLKAGRISIPEAKRRIGESPRRPDVEMSRKACLISAVEDVLRRFRDVKEASLIADLIDGMKRQ
jgi:ParB-like chromosome segregation protein Spo0J